MGRTGTRLPNFCLNRLTATIRVRSPPIHHQYSKDSSNKQTSNSSKANQANGVSDNGEKSSNDGLKPGLVMGRRIMIVVDSSLEAKGALQWALTHTVQSQDTLVLLYVLTHPSTKQDEDQEANGNKKMCPKIYDLLSSVKNLCHVKRPEVQVEVVVVEGKEKGSIIVAEAKKQGVSLLVLGQKKRSMTWRLVMMWAGNRILGGGGVVEYCIQNANCMTIAVRRKSRKLGGYLITTKRHKDFWLLA